jgi:two-component system, NtrC family, response regulator AtoC
VRITLPPLRERKEDIPLLVERFLEKLDRRFILSQDATEAMMNYDWPGNVRELMNCLERMMTFNSGPLLHFADLPTHVANDTRARTATEYTLAAVAGNDGKSAAPPVAPQEGIVPLQELEKRAIQHAIQHTRGDCTTAAQMLGIGRTTLYRKLKEYRLQ